MKRLGAQQQIEFFQGMHKEEIKKLDFDRRLLREILRKLDIIIQLLEIENKRWH